MLWSRFLTAILVLVALLGIVLIFQLRRKSGLLSDPKGIAGVASMATKSHILTDFQGMDEASLDDLEFALLASDLGAVTTDEIIARLRERALRHGIADGAELKRLLKDEILRILETVDKPVAHPASKWMG